MKMNVRCCCQPTKILGTFEVRNEWVEQRRFSLWTRPSIYDVCPPQEHVIQIRNLYCGEQPIGLAIYSEDRPVQFWRQFPEFEEAPCFGE